MTQCATVTALPSRPTTLRNCDGADPEHWFPNEPGPDRSADRATYEATARELCAGCPLAVQCLTNELRHAGSHGIWGGTAPWERDNMRRNARRVGYSFKEAAIRFHEQQEAVAS